MNIIRHNNLFQSEPYALYKNDTAPLTGNDQYEGFVIDLIHEIALLEGFNYTFIRNPDDKNGDYNETTKTWNGMIGDILSGVNYFYLETIRDH